MTDRRYFTRREMLRLSAATAAMTAMGRFTPLLAQTEAATAPAILKKRRPNILMLVADDHRHDAIRAMGDLTVQTPCFDRLITQGTAFSQAHHMGGKMAPVCVPTRGSLMTGCAVYRAMVNPADHFIAPNRVTLGEHLRHHGYCTHIVGKWHNDVTSLNRTFASGDAIFRRGVATDQSELRLHRYDPKGIYEKDTVYYSNKFSSDFFADRAIDFLQKQKGDEPFFLYTAFTAPHDPRTPPKEFAKLYDAKKIPLPANFLANHPFDNGEMHVRDEDVISHPRSPDRVRRELADYYGMVTNLDHNLGRIFAALEANGQAENTIVVYTADHGIALGQHGLMGKQNLYDHSTRVPLILRGPGVPAGQRSNALLYSWDVFPTLCELAGVEAPGDLDARSVAPILRGGQSGHRTQLHALYRDFQRMTKNERWKLIEYAVGSERRTQLFDLQNDPWETRNLATDAAAAAPLAELRGSLRNWQVACRDSGFGVVAHVS